MPNKPDYGLDAPGVVRNLLVVAAICLGIFVATRAGWSGLVPLGGNVTLDLRGMAFGVGIVCAFLALWMIWSSKSGKLRERDALLANHAWSGREKVLDVGCGRGLLLIGAAKKLTRGEGSALGVDIWQAEDLANNSKENTLANARLEGVEDRVRVETCDMRTLPLADGSIDVVVSKAAIHNLYSREERAKALGEIARVLRPSGEALIDDIRHIAEYAEVLRGRGFEVEQKGNRAVALLLGALTWGSLHPGVLIAKKK